MTICKQVAARREHRQSIEKAIDKNWERLAPEMRKMGATHQTISELLSSQLDRLTDDDKKHLEEVMLPDFCEMLRLFREKMWLAEPNTIPHFETIIEYVDNWELSLRGVTRGSVTIELQRATDAKLRQFYTTLEATYDRLRGELTDVQSGRAWLSFIASSLQRPFLRRPLERHAGH
jgi:hypothetical protein